MAIGRTDLDDLFWDNTAPTYNTRRDPAERDHLLSEIIGQDRWIVEGVYHQWLGESFEKADVIVILDTPVWIRHWRIARRSRRFAGGRRAMRETSRGRWGLALALLYPTAFTWVYFVLAADRATPFQSGIYLVGKVVQFSLPLLLSGGVVALAIRTGGRRPVRRPGSDAVLQRHLEALQHP